MTRTLHDIATHMTPIERRHVGPRMSQMIVHGDTVYLAGQVADKAAGGSVRDQTQEILLRIDRLLGEVGSDKSKILQATIWLTDMANFAEMNAVWDAWVTPGHTPTRACVGASLAGPPYSVEIRVIAVRGSP
jgi:enamine deaminase RidA (YjgF/YER057c/UK114 family)